MAHHGKIELYEDNAGHLFLWAPNSPAGPHGFMDLQLTDSLFRRDADAFQVGATSSWTVEITDDLDDLLCRHVATYWTDGGISACENLGRAAMEYIYGRIA